MSRHEYNPVIPGNIYRNQTSLLAGKILTINEERILGVVLGGLAALAFARRRRQSTLQREAGKAGEARSRRGDAVASVYLVNFRDAMGRLSDERGLNTIRLPSWINP